ncbi:unnamed protein product [Bemisia tabaci]|uniref:CUB domain-containing protein n=2 Tax=Bemisia tabaci TaxID=7038 RepID=A0A9P0EXK3_BEMTA|nr:PREDICTED: uncharacterized protein LOC109037211 isoform X1 [Bemisia tabaci]CAH0383384.1 unnamed protein product [Bemisia tabaci]
MTICSDKEEELVFSGPHLLFEFKGGPSIPPYDYRGFLASVSFIKKMIPTVMMTETTPALTTELPYTARMESYGNNSHNGCGIQILANDSRTGHFNSRPLEHHRNCSIVFVGNPNDVVHLSVFNYKLKAPACQSYLELYDGPIGRNKPMKRICSPQSKHARDASGKFHSHETLMSSGNTFSILLHRLLGETYADVEHIDGPYAFHDEQKDGTLAPDTLCNTDYYGENSLSNGQITNPENQQIYWNVEGRLVCAHRFIPALNQSITLKITSLKLSNEPGCQTECGDAGCRCNTDLVSLSHVDHLLFMHDNGAQISCLCGNFHEDWLPVSIRSWSPLRLVYSVAHYSWTAQGFNYKTDYSFNLDGACGHHVISNHSGSLHSTRIVGGGELNYYYHQICSCTLDSNVDRQLTLELATSQNRPCTVWNFTLYEYSEGSSDHLGPIIHTFCPRDKHKVYNLAWRLNVVVIKLTAMTRTLPQYFIKWQSQVVRANTRISGQTSSILSSPSSSFSHAMPISRSPLKAIFLVFIVNLLSLHFVYR